ncbi:ubiquitin-conjugating enzyme E2 Z-like [Rhipicephalus sanguineus]|uniref:ubiquitin-conjugating enzyme E2 Z-like n=1 Tax=Rhipicephalus sanguineus TaxID=34632 RepID=UPI0018948CB0|nr:ubiquitin-conjugating enzyme E2 Z-like [Rhipicephalus sanguineus]
MFRSFVDLFRRIDELDDEETDETDDEEHLSPEPPTPTDFWDPIEYGKEEPTEECVLTVLRHIAELNDHRPLGVFAEPEGNDVTEIHALVLGPVGTPYEGGFFHFVIRCPSDYPSRPPLVRLMTTDSGRVRFHRASTKTARCVWRWGTDTTGPTWTEDRSIGNVMAAIRWMLASENPVAEGSGFGVLPALGTWLNSDICYNTVLQHETIRVAVCDAVEDCLKGTCPYPNSLRNEVLKHFPQFYGQYEKVVRERLPMTGSFMNDALYGGVAVYQYDRLLARLQDLRSATPTDIWDPIQYVNKEPTEKCLVSVLRHIKELHVRGRRLGIFIQPRTMT